MRVVLASNARRAHVQDVVSRARWHRVFDAIYTSDDVERPKPAVDVLWRICREFQFDTSELAVIDDSKAFVDAAVAVGFSAAYVIERNSDGDSDASTRNNSDSLLQLARKIALRAE
jgi:HAD superfamily hydrolase (TIGR01509 family)